MISRFLNQVSKNSRQVMSRFQRFFSGVSLRVAPIVHRMATALGKGLQNIGDALYPVQQRVRYTAQQLRFWLDDRNIQLPSLSSIPTLPHPAALDWTSFVPQPTRLTIQGKMIAATVSILILGLVVGMLPSVTNIAYGAYSTSTTDADGNTHLGANSVNDTFYYDRSTDSSPETQRQMGIDPNWANGVSRRSYALNFDGFTSKSYVITTATVPDVRDEMTLEGWVMQTASNAGSADRGLFGKMAISGDRGFLFYINQSNGKVGFLNYANTSDGDGLENDTAMVTGTWVHIAATFKADSAGSQYGTARFYVDGVLKGINTHFKASTYVSSVGMVFGRFYNTFDYGSANAIIDEVRLSNTVRYTGSTVGTSYFTPERRYKEDVNTAGLWHFDEGVGTTIKDSSIYGSDGTLACTVASCSTASRWVTGANAIMDGYDGTNGYQTASGAGNVKLSDRSSDSSDNAYELKATGSNALDFEKSNSQYITVADPSNGSLDFGSSTNFTLEAWVNIESLPSANGVGYYNCIITKNASTYPNYQLCLNTTDKIQAGYQVSSGVDSLVTSPTAPAIGQWMHIAVTVDRTNGTTLWVNGQSVATAAAVAGSLDSTNALYIGGHALTGNNYKFDGLIDEVRISNSVRYTSSFTPGRRFATDSNTVGLWHFDEGSGTSSPDSSGYANNPTFTAAPGWGEGIYSNNSTDTSSQNWALPGYSYRKKVSVAANAAMDAGYGVETTADRASALNNKQSQADGKDWRVVYQPSDTARSLSFDNGDTVTVPNSSSLNVGTSDFTIEAWVKGSSMADSDVIVAKTNGGGASSSYGYLLGTFDSLKPTLYFASSGTHTKIQGANSLVNGQWYHIAVVVDRDDSTKTKMFVNGTEDNTAVTSLSSNTASVTNTVPLVFGSESDGGFNWEGKIDEVRISNTVRYTGNFTSSRNQFTPDSNTLGLWHLDEGSGQYIVDSSTNANNGTLGADSGSSTDDPTWSTDGVVSTVQEVPRFIPHGNAAVFNGANYVSLGAVPGSTVATTELWFKPDGTDYTNAQVLVGASRLQGFAGSYQYAIMATHTGNCPDGSWSMLIGRGTADINSGQVVCAGTGVANNPESYNATNFPSTSWTHLAVTYDGTTIRMFRNGNLVKTATQTIVAGASGEQLALGKLGAYDGGYYKGMLDEVRISTNVRYTKSFTPQTTPFAKDANTLVLLHLDESDNITVNDDAGTASGNFNTNVASNRAFNGGKIDSINQTQFKTVAPVSNGATDGSYYLYYGSPNETTSARSYDNYALAFDGTNDYVDAGDLSALEFTGDFTISAWIKPGTISSYMPIFGKSSVFNEAAAKYQMYINSNKLSFAMGGTVYNGASSGNTLTVTAGQWSFVSVSRSGSTVTLRVNNSTVTTTNSSTPSYSTETVKLGAWSSTGTYYSGQMDDVRAYSRALSSSEMASLMTNVPLVSNTSLTGYWKLDDTTVAGTGALNSASGASATLTNFNFNSSSNWVLNTNLASVTSPTVTASTTAEQESPTFFEYRAFTPSTGAWTSDRSKVFQLTTGEQQLGSTGVYVSFNPQGVYSKEDHYVISSWAIENSPSGGIRGVKNSFPQKANIIASGATNATGYVDIIDATTNKLWMRLTTATNNLLPVGSHSSSPVALSVTALNGRLYISNFTGGMIEVQFDQDDAHRYEPSGSSYSGNGSYSGNIAQRNSASGYQTAGGSTMYASATVVYKVCAAVISGKQYAVATTEGGLSVVQNTTSFEPNSRSGTILNYSYAVNTQYTSCALTSGGELYGATGTLVASASRRLNRWDNVHNDTSSRTAAVDATYDTGTAPVLRNTTINNISVTEGASTADTAGTSNTIVIAHTTGVDVVQEHTTKTSGTVRYYTRAGSAGTSGWNARQFNGALSFDGTDDYVVMNSTAGATPFNFSSSDYTVESWIKAPSDITNGATIASQFGAGGAGNAAWRLAVVNSSGTLYLYVAHHDGTNTGAIQSTGTFTADAWHHVAANYVNSTKTLTFYIDGVAAGSGTLSNVAPQNATNYNVYVGRDPVGSTYFKGQMDELRISKTSRYSAAFTPSSTPFDGTTANTSLNLHFDEQSGTTVSDSSTNSYSGTLTNGPVLIMPAIGGSTDNVTAAMIGGGRATNNNALNFASAGNRVQAANESTFDIESTSPFTLEAWVNTTSGTNGMIVAKEQDTGTYNGYYMGLEGSTGKLFGIVQSGTSTLIQVRSSSTINDGKWHHVAMTYSGTQTAAGTGLYIDGVKQSLTIDSNNLGTGTILNNVPLNIGSRENGAIYFTGSIDEVQVSNIVRYNGSFTPARYNNPDVNTLGLWHFDEASSGTSQTTTADASGRASTGTLTNSPTWTSGSQAFQRGVLWIATNDSSVNDAGALTAISMNTGRFIRSITTSTTGLPDNDINAIALTSTGNLALVGTEDAGAWNPGLAGYVVDDTATSVATTQQVGSRVKSGGTVRIKSGGSVRVKPN